MSQLGRLMDAGPLLLFKEKDICVTWIHLKSIGGEMFLYGEASLSDQ